MEQVQRTERAKLLEKILLGLMVILGLLLIFNYFFTSKITFSGQLLKTPNTIFEDGYYDVRLVSFDSYTKSGLIVDDYPDVFVKDGRFEVHYELAKFEREGTKIIQVCHSAQPSTEPNGYEFDINFRTCKDTVEHNRVFSVAQCPRELSITKSNSIMSSWLGVRSGNISVNCMPKIFSSAYPIAQTYATSDEIPGFLDYETTLRDLFGDAADNITVEGDTINFGNEPTLTNIINNTETTTVDGDLFTLTGSSGVASGIELGDLISILEGTGISTTGNGSDGVTIGLKTTGVSAGGYGTDDSVTSFVVNPQGQLLSVTSVGIDFAGNSVTSVTAGAGLTGGGGPGAITLDIGAGSGVTINANDIEIDTTTTGDTATTSNNSGLEASSDGLSLLRGCADAEILKWDNTAELWECATDADAGGGFTFDIDADSGLSESIASGDTVDFVGGTGLSSVVSATDTITFNLDDTAVTPGSFGTSSSVATFTVDQQGRLTAAGSTGIDFLGNSVTTVTAGAGLSGGGGPGAITLDVTAGSGISIVGDAVTNTGVLSVGGSGPIVSSGGQTPSISCPTCLTSATTILFLAGDSGPTQALSSSDTIAIAGGTGLSSVATASDTVTLDLDDTAVTTGSYGNSTSVATFIVDQQGRLTAAGSTAIDFVGNAVTTVTAGAGLTGGGGPGAITVNIGAGNGIIVNANDIAIDVATTGDTVTTSSNSGLETTADGLSLLRGCADGEILKWDNTAALWECAADSAAAGGFTFDIGGDTGVNESIATGNTIEFVGGDGLSSTVSATDTITYDIDLSLSGTTATTSSGSGLEIATGDLTLLRGCADGEILKWDAVGEEWYCSADSGAAGSSFTLAGDTGAGQSVSSGDTMTVVGGTGLSSATSAVDTVTINLDDTTVVAGSYTPADNGDGSIDIPGFTVNAQGQLTAASTTAITITGIPNSSLVNSSLTVPTSGPITGGGLVSLGGSSTSISCPSCLVTGSVLFTASADSGSDQTISNGNTLEIAGGTGLTSVASATDTVTLNLDDTTVSAGTYGTSSSVPTFTVDAQGRLTSASNTAINFSGNAVTSITAGAGLTGGGGPGVVNLDIGAGFGITVNANDITVDATTTGTTATTSSNSGLETTSAGLSLLRGCIDTEILKWDATAVAWECATDGGTGFTVAASSGPSQGIANGDTLTLLSGTGISTVASATDNVTFNLTSTGVSAGSYGTSTSVASFTVNAQGRLSFAGNTAIAFNTGVIAGAGLTQTGSPTTTLNVGSGNGITVNADNIEVDATTTGTTATTSSNSGLETTASGVSLLRGCADGEILKWDAAAVAWECAPDIGQEAGTRMVNKTVDEVEAGTAFQNDDELFFNIGAGETWAFRIAVSVNAGTSSDIKFIFTTPAGSSCNYAIGVYRSNVNTTSNVPCTTSSGQINTAGADEVMEITAVIENGGTAGTVQLQWAKNSAPGGSATIYKHSTLIAVEETGADLAENYYTNDINAVPGTIVTIDNTLGAGVKSSTAPYQSDLLGVISTKPGQVLSDSSHSTGGRPVPLALAGRVPVRVTNEGGAIAPGDMITSSSTAGKGMKANNSGQVIGRALTGLSESQSDGTILMFIEPGFYQAKVKVDFGSLLGGSDSVLTLNGDQLPDGIVDLMSETVTLNEREYSAFDQNFANDLLSALKNQDVRISDLEDRLAAIEGLSDADLGQGSINGALEFDRESAFLEAATFKALVTFDDKVTFNNDATFVGNAIFNNNTAGNVVIPTGSTSVNIEFDNTLPSTPTVTASPGSFVYGSYRITGATSSGFTIELQNTQASEIKFNWTAILTN